MNYVIVMNIVTMELVNNFAKQIEQKCLHLLIFVVRIIILFLQISKNIYIITCVLRKKMKSVENPVILKVSVIEIPDQYQSRCHRGLDLHVWLNNKNNQTSNTCLYSPSFLW